MIKKFLVAITLVAMLVGTANAFVSDEFYPYYGNKSPECFMSIDYSTGSSAPAVWIITRQGAEVGRAYIRTDGKLWRDHPQTGTDVIPCCTTGTVDPIWYCPETKEVVVTEVVEPVEVKEVVVETPEGPVTFVVYFDFDEDIIREDQEVILQSLVEYVTKYGYTTIKFEASCDYRGSDTYNMDLGARRAAAAQHWLIENGLDATTFSVTNHGDRLSPIRFMKGLFCADCWSDRRVEVTVE